MQEGAVLKQLYTVQRSKRFMDRRFKKYRQIKRSLLHSTSVIANDQKTLIVPRRKDEGKRFNIPSLRSTSLNKLFIRFRDLVSAQGGRSGGGGGGALFVTVENLKPYETM